MDHPRPSYQKLNHVHMSSELLIQEIPDDEIRYDADVEVLRPDAYEEPDSERSEAASSTKSEGHRDNELVKHMKSLSCNTDSQLHSNEEGSRAGRKRRSKDAFGAAATQISNALSGNQIEVTEVPDDGDKGPSAKRTRRRSRRSKIADGLCRQAPGSESEPRANEDGNGDSRISPNESAAFESSPREHPDEAMDID